MVIVLLSQRYPLRILYYSILLPYTLVPPLSYIIVYYYITHYYLEKGGGVEAVRLLQPT